MVEALAGIKRDEHPPGLARNRILALVEVVVAFAVVHVCWRSFKNFTRLGQLESSSHQNYSAGIVMIAFAVLAVRSRGWKLSDFGLNLKDWRYNLKLGILWGLIWTAAAATIALSTGFHPSSAHPAEHMPWRVAILGCCAAVVGCALLLVMLRKSRPLLAAIPLTITVGAFVILWMLPVLAAVKFHRPVGHMVAFVGWRMIGAGFGEEIFFRGYLQTRMDIAFGRPVEIGGARVGIGLIVSSLLFGLVHALNSVDYFHRHFEFSWPFGLLAFFTGAFFGILRERSGSLFPGAIAHGLSDVLQVVPG